MTFYNYLKLQPVDPQDDGSVSDLDAYDEDETIDLTDDIDEETLDKNWSRVLNDLHDDTDDTAHANS